MSHFVDTRGYDAFMGRWSRRLGHALVRFAGIPAGARVLDVGCGTGALADALLETARPSEIVGVDPNLTSVEIARARFADPRVRFQNGDVQSLGFHDGSFDASVAMLVLNFVPERERAVAEMRRVTRAGGLVVACVWDYSEGMTMLRRFWDAAVAIDPSVDPKDERHMPLGRAGELAALWRASGLEDVREGLVAIEMAFTSFRDYWEPFLAGVGPAGRHAASLPPESLATLERRLGADLWDDRLDEPRALPARAWAVAGVVPSRE